LAVSRLADNVILLRYSLGGDTVERAMIVIKARATRHDQAVYPFEIGSSGLRSAAVALPD
jgi:circadian clock protein KaiC